MNLLSLSSLKLLIDTDPLHWDLWSWTPYFSCHHERPAFGFMQINIPLTDLSQHTPARRHRQSTVTTQRTSMYLHSQLKLLNPSVPLRLSVTTFTVLALRFTQQSLQEASSVTVKAVKRLRWNKSHNLFYYWWIYLIWGFQIKV